MAPRPVAVQTTPAAGSWPSGAAECGGRNLRLLRVHVTCGTCAPAAWRVTTDCVAPWRQWLHEFIFLIFFLCGSCIFCMAAHDACALLRRHVVHDPFAASLVCR